MIEYSTVSTPKIWTPASLSSLRASAPSSDLLEATQSERIVTPRFLDMASKAVR